MALANRGPLTDFEIADFTGWQQTSIGKRRGECAKAGLVIDTGKRRASPSGSSAIVWESRLRAVRSLLPTPPCSRVIITTPGQSCRPSLPAFSATNRDTGTILSRLLGGRRQWQATGSNLETGTPFDSRKSSESLKCEV